MTFKNALCLERQPESTAWSTYWQRCQRHDGHPEPHRSKWREWRSGDRESKPRSDKDQS